MKLFTTLLTSLTITAAIINPVQAQDEYDTSACLLLSKVYKIQLAVTASKVPSKVGNYVIDEVCTVAPTAGGQMFYEMSKELNAQIKAKNANPSNETVESMSDVLLPQENYTPNKVR